MFGIEQLRERIAVLERDVNALKEAIQSAVPVMMMDKEKVYVIIVPDETPDEECQELNEALSGLERIIIKGVKFKVWEVS